MKKNDQGNDVEFATDTFQIRLLLMHVYSNNNSVAKQDNYCLMPHDVKSNGLSMLT